MTLREAEAERIQLPSTLSPSPPISPSPQPSLTNIMSPRPRCLLPRRVRHSRMGFPSRLLSPPYPDFLNPVPLTHTHRPIESLTPTTANPRFIPPPSHHHSIATTQSQHAPATPPPPHQHHPTTSSHVHHSRMGLPSRLLSPPHPDLPHPLPLLPCLPTPPTAAFVTMALSIAQDSAWLSA